MSFKSENEANKTKLDNMPTKVKEELHEQDYVKPKSFNARKSIITIESSDEDDKENINKVSIIYLFYLK